jgi:hypothetical protein
LAAPAQPWLGGRQRPTDLSPGGTVPLEARRGSDDVGRTVMAKKKKKAAKKKAKKTGKKKK